MIPPWARQTRSQPQRHQGRWHSESDFDVMAPKTITIVSSGSNGPVGEGWKQEARDGDFFDLDCRDFMKRVEGAGAKHEQDGAFQNTQRIIFQQNGWTDVMRMIADKILEGESLFSLRRKQGLHRSNVSGRMLENMQQHGVRGRLEALQCEALHVAHEEELARGGAGH